MRTLFKRFLLVFMMLALPVQAFASVALLACDMSIPAAVAKVSAAPMDHAMNGCHEDAAENTSLPADDHQCSHCAVCYLAAAFPIPVAHTALVTPIPYTPHLQRAEPISGFIPEGPERPPRTTAA